jgi:hypothetical protein
VFMAVKKCRLPANGIVGQVAKDSVDNETAIGGKIDGRFFRMRKTPMKLR